MSLIFASSLSFVLPPVKDGSHRDTAYAIEALGCTSKSMAPEQPGSRASGLKDVSIRVVNCCWIAPGSRHVYKSPPDQTAAWLLSILGLNPISMPFRCREFSSIDP